MEDYGYRRFGYSYSTRAQDWANCQRMSDLLRKQRTGAFLTTEEKKRIQKEAKENRLKNLKK